LGHELGTHVIDRLLANGPLKHVEGMIALADFERRTDPAQGAVGRQLLDLLKSAGLEPPAIAEMAEPLKSRSDIVAILKFLESRGDLVALARDRYADRGAISDLANRLDNQFTKDQELSTTDLKDAIGVSRKYLIPLLEFFDREGITRRNGEKRIWTGRLPASGPRDAEIA
jgi:selenocysteine-specific elongation factor